MFTLQDLYEHDPNEESAEENHERWRAIRAQRITDGKCWQCAKLIADCRCPNVNHTKLNDPAVIRP